MGSIKIGPVGSYITLNPGYDFSATKVLDRQDVRVKDGSLYTYIQGSHRRFNIPETWVASYNRSLVNSWWESAADLRFIEDDTFPASYFTVRVMGDEEPYQTYVEPYYKQFFKGELVIETI